MIESIMASKISMTRDGFVQREVSAIKLTLAMSPWDTRAKPPLISAMLGRRAKTRFDLDP